jgi:type II secretory pathway pseudopilin PulG
MLRHSRLPTPRRVRRFTLLELTMVMVIFLLMLALSMGALRRASRASQVGTAARQVGSAVHLARQVAITQRRHVALIMPAQEDSSLATTYHFRSYRLAYVTPAATDYTFTAWVDTYTWAYLPATVAIMEADNDPGISDGSDYTITPVDNQLTKVDGVDFFTGLRGGGAIDNVRAVVFSPSGRLLGEARYLTIGRANYNGDYLQAVEPASLATNRSSADQWTIEINRFTGHLNFLTPDKY